MDNFIFKGVSSKEFNIIVNSLPPITKPTMRVKETTIDGVDGAIIEELGYESYDKKIKITITENNIDEIISWLNGGGDLILSNEADKYYKAKVIEQIDFARLIKYEPVEITFKVQPFKYLYKETYQKFENPVSSIYALNEGLETSKPLIRIKGTGTIEMSIEGREKFIYTFPEGETEVTIDSEKQDAYLGTILKNRNMTGEFPTFKSGRNKINLTGNITEIYLMANSRWL